MHRFLWQVIPGNEFLQLLDAAGELDFIPDNRIE